MRELGHGHAPIELMLEGGTEAQLGTESVAEASRTQGLPSVGRPVAPADAVAVGDSWVVLQQRGLLFQRFELLDVRTPDERAKACIPGTTLMTEEEAQRLTALPKDTLLVFHCHHGGRSQGAAEYFAGLGFTNVHNIVEGMLGNRADPGWIARGLPIAPCSAC